MKSGLVLLILQVLRTSGRTESAVSSQHSLSQSLAGHAAAFPCPVQQGEAT